MPLVNPSFDSECNMICKADGLELCGSANRLAVYEDMDAVSLPSTGCLNSDQLHAVNDKMTFDTFHLFATPAPGTGPTVQLGTHELIAQVDSQSTFILSVCCSTLFLSICDKVLTYISFFVLSSVTLTRATRSS